MAERLSVEQRIALNVQVDMFSGCHVWQGRLDADGYGIISVNGKSRRVHRVAYELNVGPIPAKYVVDHLVADRAIAPGSCRSRACCNPAHLEAVSIPENSRRVRSWNTAKLTCPQGHEYDEQNTRIEYRKNGSTRRHCRACDERRKAARKSLVSDC